MIIKNDDDIEGDDGRYESPQNTREGEASGLSWGRTGDEGLGFF